VLDSIEDLVSDIKQGKMVLLVDDENRENEGDLVLAGEFCSPEQINFMVKEARGLVCLAMSQEQCNRLGLSLMVGESQNNSPNKTAFTVSIEAREGITTGISAADRAHTIRVASDTSAGPQSIITPGHIFPIRAKQGGVLERAGHTEGSVDLMKLSQLNPCAVICEVMNDDGTMARMPELIDFAKKHKIKIGSIEDLIEYRLNHESYIEELYSESFKSQTDLDVRVHYFKDKVNDRIHYAMVVGNLDQSKPVPVRVHVDRGPEDLFNSQNSSALNRFLKFSNDKGAGVVVVLRHSNYFSSPLSKRDRKDIGIGAQILSKLGVSEILLATNSEAKLTGLSAFGVSVVDTLAFKGFYKEGSRL
jgi:3,4-dihydroxy 2-butanone 4-phosphate synthase/GTP cyclohydrolase II